MNGIIATSDSFSICDIQRSIEFEPFKILDHLINAWRERRALRPLSYLLPAYPGILTHAHEVFQLLEALKNLKRLCRGCLTLGELRLVTQAHDLLEERLRTRII